MNKSQAEFVTSLLSETQESSAERGDERKNGESKRKDRS
jgi:hypothetical protein